MKDELEEWKRACGGEHWDAGQKGKIKDYDHKTSPKRDRYDHDGKQGAQDSHTWHDSFMANLAGYDDKWESIMAGIEGFDEHVIDDEGPEKRKVKTGIDEETIKKAMKILYLTFLQFTQGEALTKATSGGRNESFEVYREISYKGKLGPSRTSSI